MTVHTQSGKVLTKAAWKARYNQIWHDTPKRDRRHKQQIKFLRAEAKQYTYSLFQ